MGQVIHYIEQQHAPQAQVGSIRHHVATRLADKEKISLPTLSRFPRHKSLRTTEVYPRKPDESLRDAAKRLEKAHLLSKPVQEKEKAT